ncbi:MAG: acyloxyacyl hydrolase [Bacteroidales bacterium]|nr:acyloxyacyl hydrolase [Bacteroidales bacterium]
MKRLAIILLLLSMYCCMSAQRTHSLELKLYGGRIVPHRSGMDALAQPLYAGEMNYYFSTRSDNYYDLKYHFPKHGFGLNYNYFGNHKVIGSAFAAYSFLDFSFLDKQWFDLGLRVNAGLAYLTRKFDRETNPQNIAVCTNLCFYFNLSFNVVFKLPSDFELKLSPGFQHYSNGAVKKPNLGLNCLFVSLALSKDICTKDFTRELKDYQDEVSPHEAWIMGTCSTADEYSVGYEGRGGGFICSTVATGYTYQYCKLGKVGASFDMFYNENNKYYYYDDERGLFLLYDKFSDILKLGISIGHQLVYHRFELITYYGFHFYNKVWTYKRFYFRVGARYYLTDYMFINLSLKANGFKAQFIESGIGFSCRRWGKAKRQKD